MNRIPKRAFIALVLLAVALSSLLIDRDGPQTAHMVDGELKTEVSESTTTLTGSGRELATEELFPGWDFPVPELPPEFGGLGYFSFDPLALMWRDLDVPEYQYSVTMPDGFGVVDHRYDSNSDTWNWKTYRGATAYDLKWSSAATRDTYCLAGIASNGDLVIERWILAEVAPIAHGGGGAPQGEKTFIRVEIHRGPLAPEGFLGMSFDPEGRFMLVLVRDAGTTKLYRLDNQPQAPPVLELDSASYPELEGKTRVDRGHHTVLGRTWKLDNGIGWTTRIMLVDADNDGEFDGSPLAGDTDYFDSLQLNDWRDWDPLID